MRARDILSDAEKFPELTSDLKVHSRLLELHARTLACHCECLGMNAENCQRAILGQSPAYYNDSFLATMLKWGIVTEDNEPNI